LTWLSISGQSANLPAEVTEETQREQTKPQAVPSLFFFSSPAFLIFARIIKHIVRYTGFLLVILILFSSCNKNEKQTFINQYKNEITKYALDISSSDLIINSYKKYINDELVSTTIYEIADTSVIRLTIDAGNQLTHKRIYITGNSNLAVKCIDSIYNGQTLITADLHLSYDNEYLVSIYKNWIQIGENPASGESLETRIIEKENILSVNKSAPGNPSGCTSHFNYTGLINKIDIQDFSNRWLGKINKNLVKHVSWNNGCPCGPSMTVAYSNFEYETDENGFVTKMTETYTPCYHMTFTEEVFRTVTTTKYEYIFK